jgi:hypothetical protein
VSEKIPVLTAAEEVEYDATESKFTKLILHIRPVRLIHLFNTVYASLRCTFGNAPFPFQVRQFIQSCLAKRG